MNTTPSKLHGPYHLTKKYNWNFNENEKTFESNFDSVEIYNSFNENCFDNIFNEACDDTKTTSRSGDNNFLNQCFIKHKCNKGTSHNYPSFYNNLLLPYRHDISAFVEIGIGSPHQDGESRMAENYAYGSSLRGWRDFMPNATILGCDIDPRVLIQEDRITSLYIDQTNPNSFDELKQKISLHKGADVILDDGLHLHHSNLLSLICLWPLIKPGGVYMIEDMSEQIFKENLNFIKKLNLNGICYGIELYSTLKGDNRIITISKNVLC